MLGRLPIGFEASHDVEFDPRLRSKGATIHYANGGEATRQWNGSPARPKDEREMIERTHLEAVDLDVTLRLAFQAPRPMDAPNAMMRG